MHPRARVASLGLTALLSTAGCATHEPVERVAQTCDIVWNGRGCLVACHDGRSAICHVAQDEPRCGCR